MVANDIEMQHQAKSVVIIFESDPPPPKKKKKSITFENAVFGVQFNVFILRQSHFILEILK